ncbi:MAG: MarR family transcriptional regulator [Chroococcidiopsidaceae cyanobacterium CP_BM_RX_35]|nr:MarR family transcriptional regulator [Chroococcidiopsidaceae cyanobacterium CP_BM_RX_35]
MIPKILEALLADNTTNAQIAGHRNVPFYHHQKTPASNALTDLIRTVIRMNTTVQKTGTRLMRGTGITNARWQMLSELCAFEKRITVSELARHMGLTRQAIQRLADEMASDGLVEFAENPGDARAMHLLLTEAGRAAYQDAVEREWQWANAIAEDFDAEQIAGAVDLLEAITQKMQAED